MSTEINIKFINKSNDPDSPTIVVFHKDPVSSEQAVAWRIMPKVKTPAESFVYPINFEVQATWGEGDKTRLADAQTGRQYSVVKDETGIVLRESGEASQPTAIDVSSQVYVEGGVSVQLLMDETLLVSKAIVAFAQKAVFVVHPKLFWAVVEKVKEGQPVKMAELRPNSLFEQNLEGVIDAEVTLTGNQRDGYLFSVKNNPKS